MSDELNNLDKLEGKLNKPKGALSGANIHVLKKENESEVKNAWGASSNAVSVNVAEEKSGFSFGSKLFILSLIILVLAILYTGFRIFSSRNTVSNANIDISLNIKPYVEGGEVNNMLVQVQNRNSLPLKDVSLTVSYKKGVSSQDETEKIYDKRVVGEIVKDGFIKEYFDVQLYGSESESKDIVAKLEYKVTGSNAIFSKVVNVSTIIKTPPVSVHIEGPDILSQGQVGAYLISVKNNTSTTTTPFVVSLALPASFNVEMTSPKLSSKETLWRIEKLDPGESEKIAMTGSFVSEPGENNSIHAVVGATNGNSNNISVVYSNDVKSISIRKSPLIVNLSLNATNGEILKYGDRATLVVNYENNSDSILQNVELTALISGNAPVISGVTDDERGYFDSSKQSIVWNKATLPELGSVAPRSKGSVSFSVPIVTKGNDSTNLKIEIIGVADMSTASDVVTNLSKTWKVQGSTALNTWVSYKNSPFTNAGPVPPEPNTETNYTINITAGVQNSVEGAKVSFVLPVYVTWLGKTTVGNNISYNSDSRLVVWNIGKVDAATSVTAVMQVSVRPSLSHVGKNPPITSGILFESTEKESRAYIKTSLSPLSTVVSNEPWQGYMNVVTEKR